MTAAQTEALSRIRLAVDRLGAPPAGLDGPGALRLRARESYGGPATLAPISPDNVSLLDLPATGSFPKELSAVCGPEGESLAGKLCSKLLPDAPARQRVRENGPARPYLDPAFRWSPRLYARVLGRLAESGLEEWGLECRAQVGLFAVYKKFGKLRVIIDGRIPSCWFDGSGDVSLASGGAFGGIQVDSGEPIHVGGVDVANAFCNLARPIAEVLRAPSYSGWSCRRHRDQWYTCVHFYSHRSDFQSNP